MFKLFRVTPANHYLICQCCFPLSINDNIRSLLPWYFVQVSRSIGDVYMKHAQFNREPINAKFRLPEPMNMPILSANPTIISHPLQPNDSFLIFASDGLWEHLSNEQAVDIVHRSPRAVRFFSTLFLIFLQHLFVYWHHLVHGFLVFILYYCKILWFYLFRTWLNALIESSIPQVIWGQLLFSCNITGYMRATPLFV